jgi:uncharacterized protein (TIGR00369 family)
LSGTEPQRRIDCNGLLKRKGSGPRADRRAAPFLAAPLLLCDLQGCLVSGRTPVNRASNDGEERRMSGDRTEHGNGVASRRAALATAGLTANELNARSASTLPGLFGIQIIDSGPGVIESRLDVRPDLLAPNGFLHAATVIALADTSCGYGSAANLPEGGVGFTTVELKSNFLGTATDGGIACRARLVHGGRTTQVWDAEVRVEATGAVIALFRCTQMVLYPRL